VKLSQWAREQGLTYKGAWRMWKAGQLPVPAEQLPTGTIIVKEIKPPADTVGLYARVSSSDQRKDLEAQLGRLVVYAHHFATPQLFDQIANYFLCKGSCHCSPTCMDSGKTCVVVLVEGLATDPSGACSACAVASRSRGKHTGVSVCPDVVCYLTLHGANPARESFPTAVRETWWHKMPFLRNGVAFPISDRRNTIRMSNSGSMGCR
jgi:hypothetical protein